MAGTITFPFNCFVGLAVGAAEVTVPGYTRQSVTLAYCEDGVTLANTASLQWQHATAAWGTLDTAQLWDAVAGGTLLVTLSVLTALAIAQYDIARIPAAGLTATYGTVNRPYGTGRFGTFAYGTSRAFMAVGGVVLERGFDETHACAPGTWAPGPFSLAA